MAEVAEKFLVNVAKGMVPLASFCRPVMGDRWALFPCYIAFFLQTFASAVVLWRLLARLPAKRAAHLSSCVNSGVHGVVVTLVSFSMLRRWVLAASPPLWATLRLDLPNGLIDALLTQFSLAYLVVDTLYMVAFTPEDVLLIAHHLVAGLYMVIIMHLGAAGISVAFTLFLGEITSPLLNVFTIAKDLRGDNRLAAAAFPVLSAIFTVAFVTTRSIVAPPLVAWFLFTIWFASPTLPPAYSSVLGSCVFIGMVGSQLWSYKLLRGWLRAQRKQRQFGKAD